MNTGYLQGPTGFSGCWAHTGVTTYFMDAAKTYTLDGGSLMATIKETSLSAPASGPLNQRPIALERSIDGKSWTEIMRVDGYDTGAGHDIFFNLPATDHPEFRFLRVRAPDSSGGGVTGYIDFFRTGTSTRNNLAGGDGILVTAVDPAPAPILLPMQRTLSCAQDIMEDLRAEHPCWYGGLRYYDSMSNIHTYFIQEAKLDSISVKVKMAYFRFPSGPTTVDPFVLALNEPIMGKFEVQVSNDGYAWEKVGERDVRYSLPPDHQKTVDELLAQSGLTDDYEGARAQLKDTPLSDEVTLSISGLAGKDVKFVRLAAGKGTNYDCYYIRNTVDQGTNGCAPGLDWSPSRRLEGYFLDSQVTLNGRLPG